MPRLLRVILTRLGHALFLLLAVIVVSFSLLSAAPGDAAEVINNLSGGGDEAFIEQIREDRGLDRPFLVQLGDYTLGVFQGDLDDSYQYQTPVSDFVINRLWPTMLLTGSALFIAIVGGTVLGVFAAQRPTKLASHLVTGVSLFGFSAPVFWTGIMLLLVFSSWWPILPTQGMESLVLENDTWLNRQWDVFKHLVLPALTLGFLYLAQYSRIARASMLEVLGSDYIRTARAKGLRERLVIYKHGLRNAVIPVITIAGLQFSQLLSGAIVVEVVYGWPGMGTLAFSAVLTRDAPILLGVLIVSTAVVIVVNLLTDLSYRLIDPRIRFDRT
jgi:peptide/nickel transport system permease protein